MIYSMTAYADSRIECKTGVFHWEIRSVNHRFLDVSFRLPDGLYEVEPLLRHKVRELLKRGKIECYLKFEPSTGADTQLPLNVSLVEQLASATVVMARYFPAVNPVSPIEVLKWPGVIQTTAFANRDEYFLLLEKGFLEAIQSLKRVRAREGEALKQAIEKRLPIMSQQLQTIEQRIPEVLKSQRERTLAKLNDLNAAIDPNRLEQELLYWAQKIDISEEVERLKTHIAEVAVVLMQGDSVGRRLDFLMQELHREVNTIGSKSLDLPVTQATVELKVLIEQMREQIQNIE